MFLLLGCCGMVAAGLLWHEVTGDIVPPRSASSMAVRLGLALAFLLPSLGVLWAMLLVQMATRLLRGALDPLAGLDAPLLHANQRVITNTVEHMAVFCPALLALAAGVDGPQMPGVVALAIVFACARIAVWAGYLVAPMGGAIGMGATLGVTGGALAWGAVIWLIEARLI